MAVLKKRALAEYSQVVQEEASSKPLHLAKKPLLSVTGFGEESILLVLDQVKSSECLLPCLTNLQDNLPLLVEDKAAILRKLLDLYSHGTTALIKIKIAMVLAEFKKIPKFETQLIINEVQKFLSIEKNSKVCAALVNTLAVIGNTLASDSPSIGKIMVGTKQLMSNTSHLVKCSCLALLGELTPINNLQFDAVKFIFSYSKAQDPRVRTAAYDAMLRLHSRGQKLQLSIYNDVCVALHDDHENVRQSALKVAWVLSQTYTESMIPIPGSQEVVRLVDDAFAKLCQAIGDLSVNVRTLAAELLGSMTNVHPQFLEQTLDKKLMSDMRRKRSAHERHWETVTSGEWASGTRWADDKPRENLDADSISLIHSGSCGAFVHGLEDEFMEVRSAALDSLCQLALSNPQFATMSLDFLVDMYNDEIEEVRLKAIDCMAKISGLVILREDQLEIILGVLEDSNVEIREGLHRMLGACRLSTKNCIKICVQSLLDNLKRYPQDKRSIWRCLQYQGERHPNLTLLLVPELLAIHPFFDMPEADVEDPSYVCILLLVFNAAQHCPQILSMLEEHTKRHYRYLRDTISSYLPPLKLNGCEETRHVQSRANTKLFLQNVMARLNQPASSVNQIRLWETAYHDLIRLAQIDANLSHGVDLLATQLKCHLLIAKIMKNSAWIDAASFDTQEGDVVRNMIDQLQKRSLRLEYLFSNLTTEETLLVRSTRLQAMAVQLVYIVRASNSSALALSDHFVNRVESLRSIGNLPAFAAALVTEMKKLDDTKPGILSRMLLPILQSHIFVAPFCLPKTAFKLSAEILEPTGESDNPQKFLAGFVLGVSLDAEIQGLLQSQYLRVRIVYPDQHTQLIIPPSTHLKLASRFDTEDAGDATCTIKCPDSRLRTTVLISHQVWSESSHVELNLVLDVTDPEVPSALKRWRGFSEESFIIDLCKPVRVLVSPKPIKRGI